MIESTDYLQVENTKLKNASFLLDETLDKILSCMRTLINCDAGTIYLKNGKYLDAYIAQNDTIGANKKLKKTKVSIEADSSTLSVESLLQKKIIDIKNVYEEKKYDFTKTKEFDKKFLYKTTSIISSPLMVLNSTEPIGVLQLINKKDAKETVQFSQKDKTYLLSASYCVAIAIIDTQKMIKALNLYKDTANELARIANKDKLTNLYNRYYFNNTIKGLTNLSEREARPISFLMVDIDNFKRVNDTYGHNAGDHVIQALADIFIKNTRNSDVPIRYGGEEFLIVLPYTSSKNAFQIADKIRLITQETNVLEDGIKIKFTISIGISELNKSNQYDVRKALITADKALYKAKNNGKNKVVIQ
ncbi:diguanylate cyclase (GGDEF domain) [hydrothermal vent metagenome]|uniref:Diguanylate cyclase (GGDEF domain) n=1 Tax=hydrothermal vent metagenome TaxID=652676 RepID=A0A3B1E4V3_9ZZZZ